MSSPPKPSAAAAAGHRPGGSGRIASWETLRVLAFLDVVAFHINDQHALLGIGLPIFLILALGLGVRRPVPQPTGEFMAVRVRRLLVPWLVWSVLIGILVAWSATRHHLPLSDTFNGYMLLYGTSDHLWFLPFAVVAGLLTLLLDGHTKRVPLPALVAGTLAAAAALTLGLGTAEAHMPLRQWAFASASIPLGLLLGRLLASGQAKARPAWVAVLAVSALTMVALAARVGFAIPSTPEPAFRYAMSVALLSAGALLPTLGDPWSPRLEPLLLGAYVLHPLLQERLLVPAYLAAGLSPAHAVNLIVNTALTLGLVFILRRTWARSIL